MGCVYGEGSRLDIHNSEGDCLQVVQAINAHNRCRLRSFGVITSDCFNLLPSVTVSLVFSLDEWAMF